MKKKYKSSNSWKNQLTIVFSKLWQHDKRLFLVTLMKALVSAVSPFSYIIFFALIVDELVMGYDFFRAALFTGLMFLVNFALGTAENLLDKQMNIMSLKMTFSLTNEVRQKCMDMDYEIYNDNAIRDRAQIALRLAYDNNFVNLLNSIQGILSNVIILMGVITIVTQINWRLLFVALAVVITQCWIHYKNTKANIEIDMAISSNERNINYVNQLTDKPRIKKDISIFKMDKMILRRIFSFQEEFVKLFIKRTKTNSLSQWLTMVLSIIFQVTAYIFLGLMVFARTITLGNFTMGINALNSFSSATRSLIQNMININAKIHVISKYNSFLKIPSKFRKGTKYTLEDINVDNMEFVFENVSFKYPLSIKYVLKDINIKINVREKIALVGENGAGKTTFVMLLTRMYDPTKGRILLNGIDIREIDYDDYLSLFSTVFQDFHIFAFSIFENIFFRDTATEEEVARVHELFKQLGMSERLAKMHRGLDTPITKELDNRGEDLSGGEVQRIAIMRALYKNGSVLILDEPTSALDPMIEAEIYAQFAKMTEEKTSIYISHRIASTRFCDRIIVFENGVMVEMGTYDELITRQGLYYKYYQLQAQYFS